MGFMDDVLGQDPDNWWNQVAMYQAYQEEAAREAAAQQAAANASARNLEFSALLGASGAIPTAPTGSPTAPTGSPTAPTGGPTAPSFDASPYRSVVDAGFSQFTPEWFANQYQAAYSPYQKGVEGQYGTSKDFLAQLAKKGQQNSSLGRGLFQQLDALKSQELTKGQSAAQSYQGGLQSQVNAAKQGLYGSIGAGADNASIGARTKAAADPLYGTKAPASTLGRNVFGSIVEPYATSRSPGGPSNPEEFAFATGGNLNLAGGAGGPEASAKVSAPKKKKT